MLDMRNGICAVCNHPEVLDAPAFEYTDDENPIRLAVTHAPDSLDFLGSKKPVDRPYGVLRMLVCRSCGFVQWFAARPERIPVDDAHGTKVVVPKR